MRIRSLIAALVVVGAGPAAAADEAELLRKIEQLEQRIRDLEANSVGGTGASSGSSWTQNVRVGGSANGGYYGGESHSVIDPDSFLVWDARLFVDAHLGEDVRIGETTVFRNLGFTFEWDLVRIGSLRNQVGELYADFQGLLGNEWGNFQVGRFQIPVGEAYLRYSAGYADKPFISSPVGGPWWWDEGVRFYGSDGEGRFGYVSSVSDGDTAFNSDSDGDKQVTLKLWWQPLHWLHLSASGLRSGEIGSPGSPASGALWLGESWARAFGSGSGVPNYQDGVAVADGPDQLDETWLVAGDAIFDFEDRVRVWLAYGRYTIESAGASVYDRTLHYWIAETILRGAWVSEVLRPFWVGLRANALATYDDDKGYLLDFRMGSSIGYNMKSLTAYSGVVGWELTPNLRLRAEYTHNDIEVVDGVSAAIRAAASQNDVFAIEVGASF